MEDLAVQCYVSFILSPPPGPDMVSCKIPSCKECQCREVAPGGSSSSTHYELLQLYLFCYCRCWPSTVTPSECSASCCPSRMPAIPPACAALTLHSCQFLRLRNATHSIVRQTPDHRMEKESYYWQAAVKQECCFRSARRRAQT